MAMDEAGKRERDQDAGAIGMPARDGVAPQVTRPGNREKAIELLRQWREDDDSPEEQESLDWLMEAMKESRKAERVPFPERLRLESPATAGRAEQRHATCKKYH
jgi:hypothetical protein